MTGTPMPRRKMNDSESKMFITREELAETFDVSPQTIARRQLNGFLPPTVPGTILTLRKVFAAWLRKKEQQALAATRVAVPKKAAKKKKAARQGNNYQPG